MTRKDLIDRVAKEFGLKKKEAEAIVKFIFQEIAETVKKGERVSIQGFGAFELRELKERKIRNPRTGEEIDILLPCRTGHTPSLVNYLSRREA
jgi:DNA-binding protein HU-beta